jgi:hypothetical protein
MADKVEEMIKEIAAKHGIAVGRNDPIFVLQTINDRLMRDSMDAQKDLLAQFAQEVETISHRWEDDARTKAERVVNAALAASKDVMERTMQDGAAAASVAMKREVDAGLSSVAAGVRVAYINLAAALITVIAAALVLWSVI